MNAMTLAEFWPLCLRRLHETLTAQQFDTWIAPLTVGEEGGAWVVYGKTQFASNMLQNQFAAKFEAVRAELAPAQPPLVFKAGRGVSYPMAAERPSENGADAASVSQSDAAETAETQTAPQAQAKPAAKQSAQDILAERLKNLPAKPRKTKTAEETAAPKIAKTVHEISKQQRPEQRPLEYRVPRANGATHTFAEVGNGTAFSLLDRDSINSQLPQIAMKPAAKNSKTTAVSEMRTDGQQNNITIHTDSLVFTLLGDGQGGTSMSPVAAPNTLALGNHAPTIPPTKNDVALSPSGEFNWMAASIAALMVLIMQLFYWVLDIH